MQGPGVAMARLLNSAAAGNAGTMAADPFSEGVGLLRQAMRADSRWKLALRRRGNQADAEGDGDEPRDDAEAARVEAVEAYSEGRSLLSAAMEASTEQAKALIQPKLVQVRPTAK